LQHNFTLTYNQNENRFYITTQYISDLELIVSFREIDSNLTLYVTNFIFNDNVNYWTQLPSLYNQSNLKGLNVEFYNKEKTLLFNKKIIINDSLQPISVFKFDDDPFNSELHIYYNDFQRFDIYSLLNISNEDLVLDLGCHRGSFTMFCLNRGCKKIIGVEPNPISYQSYMNTFSKVDNVIGVMGAITTKDELLEFYVQNNEVGSSLISDIKHDYQIYVQGYTIEKIIEEYNINNISLLKMDIEGVEFDVLKQLNPLTFSKIKKMVVEFHYSDINKITTLLTYLNIYFTYNIKENNRVDKEQFTIFFFNK
jgi:FkbM family methyltransferase